MPNHIHLITILKNEMKGHKESVNQANQDLLYIIGRFKSYTTYVYNKINNTKGALLWQRSYYEHVIRYEQELFDIREYIRNNPARWEEDKYYSKI